MLDAKDTFLWVALICQGLMLMVKRVLGRIPHPHPVYNLEIHSHMNLMQLSLRKCGKKCRQIGITSVQLLQLREGA